MIETVELVLGIVFMIVAPLVVGLLGGVLAWNVAQKRAAMKRGDI